MLRVRVRERYGLRRCFQTRRFSACDGWFPDWWRLSGSERRFSGGRAFDEAPGGDGCRQEVRCCRSLSSGSSSSNSISRPFWDQGWTPDPGSSSLDSGEATADDSAAHSQKKNETGLWTRIYLWVAALDQTKNLRPGGSWLARRCSSSSSSNANRCWCEQQRRVSTTEGFLVAVTSCSGAGI